MTTIRTILSELIGTKLIRKHEWSEKPVLYDMYQCQHCLVLVPEVDVLKTNNLRDLLDYNLDQSDCIGRIVR